MDRGQGLVPIDWCAINELVATRWRAYSPASSSYRRDDFTTLPALPGIVDALSARQGIWAIEVGISPVHEILGS